MQYNRNYDFSEGTTIIADQVDAEFNSIRTVINGNIDTDNLADDAVTTDQIAANTVSAANLASAITSALCPAGSILAYGGTTAPTGWLLCDGSSLLRTEYQDLFTAIGTAYGTADATHFSLPDFRGAFLRGVDHGRNWDPDRATRSAFTGGNSGDNVGSYQDHIHQSHNHTQNAHGHSATLEGVWFTPSGSTANRIAPADGGSAFGAIVNVANATATNIADGGNETRPININVEYIIKT